MIDRRKFMKTGLALGTAFASGGSSLFAQEKVASMPSYLKGFEDLYAEDPHKAALAWFKDARFGLFMHYGLYSQLGKGEWIQYKSKIPVSEYEKLTETFNPQKFDADFITDLALEAGMKYINLTSKHHDGFCLFDSKKGNWNSMAVAKRDLCAELAEQCDKKGLGCFFYYSLPMDWHHPYFLSREYGQYYRPDYEVKPEQYKFEKIEDFQNLPGRCEGAYSIPADRLWSRCRTVVRYLHELLYAARSIPAGRDLCYDSQDSAKLPDQLQTGVHWDGGFCRA